MSRYTTRKLVTNDEESYESSDIFEERGVKKIIQYQTPTFKRFTREEYNKVRFTRYYWKNGDKFWKLADKYYSDPTLWWVIARWNFAPTESHLEEGQEIRIPRDLPRVMRLIK